MRSSDSLVGSGEEHTEWRPLLPLDAVIFILDIGSNAPRDWTACARFCRIAQTLLHRARLSVPQKLGLWRYWPEIGSTVRCTAGRPLDCHRLSLQPQICHASVGRGP
jgi:hypothetical protein